jgi:hypothetical protein
MGWATGYAYTTSLLTVDEWVEQQAMPIQPLSCTTSLLSINVSTLTVFQIWLWLPVVHRSYVTITHGLTLILNAPLFASIMSGLNLYYVKIWLQFYPVDTTTGLTLVSCPELVFSSQVFNITLYINLKTHFLFKKCFKSSFFSQFEMKLKRFKAEYSTVLSSNF